MDHFGRWADMDFSGGSPSEDSNSSSFAPESSAGWKRVAESEVRADRSLPLLLIRIPSPSITVGDSAFLATVETRDMPEYAESLAPVPFMEVIPGSFAGALGEAMDLPILGEEVGGFRLPMTKSDPEFNRQFYIKKPLKHANVLFTIRAIGNDWVYSVPPYAIQPWSPIARNYLPKSFVVAVDDGWGLFDHILNVMIFNPMTLGSKMDATRGKIGNARRAK